MEITTISRLILRRWWLLALPVAVSFIAAVVALIDESGTGIGGYQAQIRYSAAQELTFHSETAIIKMSGWHRN